MALDIIPKQITVIPGDRQEFQALGVPGKTLWRDLVNGTVEPDGSVLLTNTANQGDVYSAQWLAYSPGYFEWVLDASCLPSGVYPSGGWLEVTIINDTYSYGILLYGDKRAIGSGTFSIPSGSFTSQGGDRYRIQIDGQRHLYFNGVLIHETQPPFSAATEDATKFPVWIKVRLKGPVISGTPRIPIVAVQGDWQLIDSANIWTPPATGSVTPSTGAKTIYSNGAIPGEWPIKAQVGDSPNQEITANISIPPLVAVGNPSATLQPGQKARFRTNYDAAQNDVVAWSIASGGGTFDSAHNYTAPVAPGSSVIRASYGLQNADFNITVPAVLTPEFTVVAAGEYIDWYTNLTSPTWTASAGVINAVTGFWQAPTTVGQVVRITASGGTLTVSKDVLILDKFPLDDPSAPITWERKKTVLISKAEDRSRATRVKDKGGLAYESWELVFKDRDLDELVKVHEFWDKYYPGGKFIFEDKLRKVRKIVYFDSDIRQEGNSSCGFDISFRIIEA